MPSQRAMPHGLLNRGGGGIYPLIPCEKDCKNISLMTFKQSLIVEHGTEQSFDYAEPG